MVDQIRIPPRRPYLTLAETARYLLLALCGTGLFMSSLGAQYRTLQDAFSSHPSVTRLRGHIPTSSLDGLFAARSAVLGVSVPSGLTAGVGLLILVYCLAQFGFRLSIQSRFVYDYFFPLAPSCLIAGTGLWLATFSTVDRSLILPWNYVLGLQVFFFGEPLITVCTPAPDKGRILIKPALGVLAMFAEYHILAHVYKIGGAKDVSMIVVSVPAAVLVTFVLLMLWMFKINQTGEYGDYYVKGPLSQSARHASIQRDSHDVRLGD